ncbi:hypothetical protein C4564_03820 [Candidatus Microgenomates bacterium]|nr:MAG: hypothetical protein C4564_03820 [Candidatus Microgenomates bacterium]
MKISFIGLSCFLLENSLGGKVLLDAYKDSPEHSLGIRFPSNLQADLFFVSHPDDDHSSLSSRMLLKRSASHEKAGGKDLFPNIDIRGTLVKEYNGDLNIAYSFSLDGIRFLHMADNAHELTALQIEELGSVDVVFMSPPKVVSQNYHIKNIKKINPKVVFVSHYIPPETEVESPARDAVIKLIKSKLSQDWITNPHASTGTVNTFTNMFFEGLKLKDNFDFEQIFGTTIAISKEKFSKSTKVYMFRKCLGN